MRAPIDSCVGEFELGIAVPDGAGMEIVSFSGAGVVSGDGVLGALLGTGVTSATGGSVGVAGVADSDGIGIGVVA